MSQVAPPAETPGEAGARSSVQRGAHMLVEEATKAQNLCRLDPTWHPWF